MEEWLSCSSLLDLVATYGDSTWFSRSTSLASGTFPTKSAFFNASKALKFSFGLLALHKWR
jgi:hypothetical protein